MLKVVYRSDGQLRLIEKGMEEVLQNAQAIAITFQKRVGCRLS